MTSIAIPAAIAPNIKLDPTDDQVLAANVKHFGAVAGLQVEAFVP